MFSTIVIGVDGGPGGRDAIALARTLAADGARLVAITAAPLATHPPEGANEDYDADAQAVAEARLQDTLAGEPGVEGQVLFARSAASALQAAAEREGADLIVIGSSRRGAIGRLLAGDDAKHTMHLAPVAVAVAPVDYALADPRIETIGVGWDGGAQAAKALAVAQEIAADRGASVHALTVSTEPLWPPAGGVGPNDLTEAEVPPGAKTVDALAGVHATEATGVAAEELARFADEVDLLVIGSRRSGVVTRLLLGSTADMLLHSARHPLLVVPRVAEPEHDVQPAPMIIF